MSEVDLKRLEENVEKNTDGIHALQLINVAQEKDHEKFMKFMEQITASVQKVEDIISKGLIEIQEKYVSKDTLKMMQKEGKYEKIVWGLIGAILTFVIIGAIGISITPTV